MDPTTPLEEIFRILPAQKKALHKLGIESALDLLYHFPNRYIDRASTTTIDKLEKGEVSAVVGTISGLKTKKAFRKKLTMAEAWVEDPTGKVKIVWFNQPYLAHMIEEGSTVRVEGKPSEKNGRLTLSNPRIESVSTLFDENLSPLSPIYPETRGITSNWIHHKIEKILASGILETLEDPIPHYILKKYSLPSLKSALIYIHLPKKLQDAEASRKRFSFEEIFFIQLERQKVRLAIDKEKAFLIDKDRDEIDKFMKRFPFEATESQKRVINSILEDFKKGSPMSRLLEGDVGSGKTAVAATATYAVATSRPFDHAQSKLQEFGTLQVAYMAPTEILAEQHFESFIKYFSHLPINIALITGSGAKKFPSKVNPGGYTDISRSQLKKWVENGEIAILIGTHALIQKSVKFKHLALAIVDEQHRFGTAQRQKLGDKGSFTPHFLSMTATPIPRTLALTIYGDLDISLLDEMPKGRKEIVTKIVKPDERGQAYTEARRELQAGRQMYVICPRIDPPDSQARALRAGEPDPEKELAVQPARPHDSSGAGGAKSVKAEAKRLKEEVFPEYEIDIVHSKMRPKDKAEVMDRFKKGEIDILVSTSVVEVGVSVENASIIIIEGAERFGLAQLHQLRGRVIRGTHEPYCFIFAESKSEKTTERLKAIEKAKNGFELAEFDLAQRGAGDLYGKKQWGISDVGMEAIKNLKMVEAARTEATHIVKKDPSLKKHPSLQKKLEENSFKIHFE